MHKKVGNHAKSLQTCKDYLRAKAEVPYGDCDVVEGTDITDSDRWIGVSTDPMIREVMAGGRTAITATVMAGGGSLLH